MPQDLPIVCSLGAGDLEQRLAAIGEIGAKSLVDSEEDAGRHLLRFRPDPGTRERLEAIIEAEGQCCAFLDLALEENGSHLILSVAAPEAGQATADGFAMAFHPAGPEPTS
ncbi:MAG TPA: hypothetical protein VN756_11110 [Solirubrobacterales bacterium]|nr:hypothetical protein [Solirubrobacterales bacterium]